MSTGAAVDRPAAWRADWQAARRLLAVRLDNLGDLLMTTPALAALRHADGVQLTLLGGPASAAAVPHLPMLHDAIVYDAPWMKGAPGAERPADADRALIDRLAAGRYDAAVIFTVATQSALPAALMCRLAGIPLRLAHSRENPYGLLTDWVAETDAVADGMRHEVVRQLDLAASVGFRPRPGGSGAHEARRRPASGAGAGAGAGAGPPTDAAAEALRFHVGPGDALGMAGKFERAGGPALRVAGERYIAVHPGASAPSRRYPAERFAEAADRLAERTGRLVVWSGSAEDGAAIETARAGMRHPGVSLAGQLTLGELGALVAGADVLLCNNSAPAHLAAAVGTPVVVLYALTNPQHTPWRVPSRVLSHDVPCRHCLKSVCPQRHHRCLLGVTAQAVAEAALGLMGATADAPDLQAEPGPATAPQRRPWSGAGGPAPGMDHGAVPGQRPLPVPLTATGLMPASS